MSDNSTVRLVAAFAGLVVLVTLAIAGALLLTDRPVDPTVVGIGGTALGGLLGLLAPSPVSGRQEVVVRNRPDEAVPVEPGDAGHADVPGLVVIAAVAVIVVVLYHLLTR